MARSRRKLPIAGVAAFSDKQFKVFAHRQERRAVKVALDRADELPSPKLFGDPWDGPKDGKIWWRHYPKVFRK